MEFKLTRELLGRFGQGGWRPYLGWGLSTGVILIVFAVAWRLFNGTLGLTELAALAAGLAPLMQYIQLRGPPIPGSPTGGLVNNAAIA